MIRRIPGGIAGALRAGNARPLRRRAELLRRTLHRNNEVIFVRNRRRYRGLVLRILGDDVLVSFRANNRETTDRIPFEAILRVVNA